VVSRVRQLKVTKNRQQRAVIRVYVMMRALLIQKTDITTVAKWEKKTGLKVLEQQTGIIR